MKRLRSILKGIGMGLCVLGFLWFLMPLLKGGTGIGMMLGVAVCVLGFLLLLGYRLLSRKGSWQRIAVRVVSVCYVLGLCWCGYLTILMSSAQSRVPPPGTNVMVLGSQVYGIEKMGVSLTKRVERAREYLAQNPVANCIVTGGQGSNEPVSEAQGMYDDLVKKGIDPKRLILEDQSTNTVENLRFSRKLIPQEVQKVGIVTSNFHVYRSLRLAKQQGFLDPVGTSADSGVYFLPNNVLRECFGIVKDRLYGNLKFF